MEEQVFNIFDQIKKTSSRNEKENILRTFDLDPDLKKILQYTYDPYKIYGIGKKTFDEDIIGKSMFESLYSMLDYLEINNTGTDIIKSEVNKFLNRFNTWTRAWYVKILLKDLGIGITSKTINKVFPGLIPTFDCMLASPYENRKFEEILIEPKLDGYRCLFINGKLFTRNGKQIEGYDYILSQINFMLNTNLFGCDDRHNIVFDGELLGKNFALTQESVFKKESNKKGLVYNIFDCIPLEEFKNGKSQSDLIFRKRFLDNIFCEANIYAPDIKIVPDYYYGKNDPIIIEKYHEQIVKQGYEGSMIKDANSLYECRRTKTWLKKKDFDMHDLKVIDIFEGNDQLKGMLGGVVVEYKGCNVKVGSGFNEEDRIKFWNNPELILNKTIFVQAQEESKNKKDNSLSLRFPVFKGIRIDK